MGDFVQARPWFVGAQEGSTVRSQEDGAPGAAVSPPPESTQAESGPHSGPQEASSKNANSTEKQLRYLRIPNFSQKWGVIPSTLCENRPTANIPAFTGGKIQTKEKHTFTLPYQASLKSCLWINCASLFSPSCKRGLSKERR